MIETLRHAPSHNAINLFEAPDVDHGFFFL